MDKQQNYEEDLKLQNPSKKIKTENQDMKKPLKFNVLKQWNKARASTMTLPHADVLTPVYMPVGTKGTIKGVTSQQMENLDCRILLGNTYHLAFQPGGDYLKEVGGLHKFMNWKRNILTDSGGFQMVSLSKLCNITEQGVTFESPVDGSLMNLRPEDSMYQQNCIGGDIMMALDDVVKTTTEGTRMAEANERTIRWIDRNIEAHQRPTEQNIFPIVQGGLDFDLRKRCLEALVEKDTNGYAIGGLSGGEAKEDFWKIVNFCTDYLPKNKPRYLMGVGYPVDLIVCACLGVDMFDCVFSTRTARFGTAFTRYGFLNLKRQGLQNDFTPIEEGCTCEACQNYTKSYLHTIVGKEEMAANLLSMHNINYLLTLMKNFRQSIIDGNVEEFVNDFIRNQFINEKVIPDWVQDALKTAGINLNIKYD